MGESVWRSICSLAIQIKSIGIHFRSKPKNQAFTGTLEQANGRHGKRKITDFELLEYLKATWDLQIRTSHNIICNTSEIKIYTQHSNKNTGNLLLEYCKRHSFRLHYVSYNFSLARSLTLTLLLLLGACRLATKTRWQSFSRPIPIEVVLP